MGLGWSLLALFLAISLPILISIVFILLRLSSRFGYSLVTLKVPLATLVASIIFMTLFWVINPDWLGSYGLYWVSGLFLLVIAILWIIDARRLRKLTQTLKTKSTNRKIVKILARIFLVIILVPMAFLAMIILWTIVTNPIFDRLDHDKFTTLDTQMQSVYQKLLNASDGADEWKYNTNCDDVSQNWLGPPDYLCTVRISTQKTISSVKELNDLQAKYSPMIDATNELAVSSNGIRSAGGFGKDFNVSLAYKDYTERKTSIVCSFETALQQTDYRTKDNDLGSPIDGAKGNLNISVTCEESARSHWYGLAQK